MIEKLTIRNFKSIKELEIDCKKINLFIGEPNTGKSNLLETLGFLNWCSGTNSGIYRSPSDYVRFRGMQNLFYDGLLDSPVELSVTIDLHRIQVEVSFQDDIFSIKTAKQGEKAKSSSLDYSGVFINQPTRLPKLGAIKFYRFKTLDQFEDRHSGFLLPPFGSNLFSVVVSHKKLRETMSRIFKKYGFNLVLKPQEKVFEIQKQVDDLVFTYPYILTSDTLQRIIFHVIAMESNQNSTLVFEEPESHAFPYYTKYLGEKIAFDETNQYFIATHNPYLLNAIIEKAPKDSVNVFVCYFQDYQTKVKCLSKSQLSELLDFDPFFNLKAFIGEEEK